MYFVTIFHKMVVQYLKLKTARSGSCLFVECVIASLLVASLTPSLTLRSFAKLSRFVRERPLRCPWRGFPNPHLAPTVSAMDFLSADDLLALAKPWLFCGAPQFSARILHLFIF